VVDIRSTKLREHLESHCGNEYRITVFYSCGDKILCSTGKVLDIFDDVLVLKGFTPTAREQLGEQHDHECEDCNSLELITFINLDRVCAVVLGVPHCRQACLPLCCKCHEHHRDHKGDCGD
jgi:hypothetical protein